MTCRQSLPAPGSMFAHDALVEAYVAWRLAQEGCEALPDEAAEAAYADLAWGRLQVHADNCGYDHARHGYLQPWAARRIIAYARPYGIDPGDVVGLTRLEADLLAALKGAVEDLESTLWGPFDGWECSREEPLGDALAAIARAEGRS